ncbi:hypothetical protein GWI33_016086 [Rhynchophorus ferrugineus]|uniref:BAG domain-containing protein n=1 Tax=Rhynchophorus ferrugineus TaxID=354439 RepID=A0A834MAP7_RHYFE|nr:hypothetical protein GWI33_016086 [Rhynchophorus ferrugineus]
MGIRQSKVHQQVNIPNSSNCTKRGLNLNIFGKQNKELVISHHGEVHKRKRYQSETNPSSNEPTVNRQRTNRFKASKTSKNYTAELKEIEEKVQTLNEDIKTAIKNKDFGLLRSNEVVLQELADNIDSFVTNSKLAQKKISLKSDIDKIFGIVDKQLDLNRSRVSRQSKGDLKRNYLSKSSVNVIAESSSVPLDDGGFEIKGKHSLQGVRTDRSTKKSDNWKDSGKPKTCDVNTDNIKSLKANEQFAQQLNAIEEGGTTFREDEQRLKEVEEKLEALKPEIISFVGVRSDNKFYELDETIMRLILLLDQLEINNQLLRQRKRNMLKELHKFSEKLNSRIE